ncbi:hypothetical protein L204_104144 [Cryptococcus depauperatus]|nr:hypothetical protein L204_03295 [Cryptococcus depauperatus CBS 7855]
MTEILAQEITGEGINRSTNREGFDRILGPTHHALNENPHVQGIIRKFADEEIRASACRGCPERRFNVDIDSTGFLLSCYDEGYPNGVSRIETRIPFDKVVLNPALAMQYYVNDLARLHLTARDATVQALEDFAPYGTPGATSLGSINTSLTPDKRKEIAESIQMETVDYAARRLLRDLFDNNRSNGLLSFAYLPGYSAQIVSDKEDLYLKMLYQGDREAVSGNLLEDSVRLGDAASFLKSVPPPSDKDSRWKQAEHLSNRPRRHGDPTVITLEL